MLKQGALCDSSESGEKKRVGKLQREKSTHTHKRGEKAVGLLRGGRRSQQEGKQLRPHSEGTFWPGVAYLAKLLIRFDARIRIFCWQCRLIKRGTPVSADP